MKRREERDGRRAGGSPIEVGFGGTVAEMGLGSAGKLLRRAMVVQEDHEFDVSLGYTVRPPQNKTK